MKSFMERSINAARKYTAWDLAIFKLCLMSLGILFGVYFAQFLQNYIVILWIVFIVSYVYIMYRAFIKHMD